MVLNSKGQVTIPAHLRAKYDLHAGDKIAVIDANGTLQIVLLRDWRPRDSG